MNSFIETLNIWGQHALRFAWPMFWQSSLLIALLFGLDYALRRKIRAAVRYALWCLVLVKLLLPPSLALPTSVAWWLRQPTAPAPAPVPTQRPATVVVTYPNTDTSPTLPSPRTIPAPVLPAQPSTPISRAAWALGVWSLISLGLLFWLGVRWRYVTQLHRSSVPAPSPAERSGLNELFESARHLAGVRQPVHCRVIERPMSPAVCGLFRPVILLPRLLADQLPAGQLRAILLHELIHLRRRDVWVNCLQALLQIFYWWHPLLWLANARIRRLREEAVDDAVMLALADQSDAYAPTLLEVAKLAYYRPLTALGLVGILESRRGLRQRIERLMNFKTPRRAGLSVVSLFGIAAFTALAMPMGEAPSKAPAPALTMAQNPPPSRADLPFESWPDIELRSGSFEQDVKTGIVRADGHVTIKSPDGTTITADSMTYDPTQRSFTVTGHVETIQTIQPRPSPITVMAALIKTDPVTGITLLTNDVVILRGEQTLFAESAEISSKLGEIRADRVRWLMPTGNSGTGERMFIPIESGLLHIELLSRGPNDLEYTNAAYQKVVDDLKRLPAYPDKILETNPRRQALIGKLTDFRINELKFDHLPLTEAVHILHNEMKNRDGRGVTFLINPSIPIDPTAGLASTNPSPEEFDASAVSITLTIHDARPIDVADAIVRGADQPIKYSLEDYAVVFSKADRTPRLFVRRFRTDPFQFEQALLRFDPSARDLLYPSAGDLPSSTPIPKVSVAGIEYRTVTNDLLSPVIRFFVAAGVDLKGKSIFWGNRDGDLLVRATAEDLDRIEKFLAKWSVLVNPKDQTEAQTNVLDGRLFFLLGKLDKAEASLRKALTLEPENKAAQYYLDLVQQARTRGLSSRRAPQPAPGNATNLYMRRFKVDPNTFYGGLETAGVLSVSNLVSPASGNSINEVTIAIKKFFAKFGVDLELPKSIFFNDREGSLLVRATEQDLDVIETAVQTLNAAPPQVTVKVKFVEVTADKNGPGFDWFLGNLSLGNGAAPREGTSPSGETSSSSAGTFPGGSFGPGQPVTVPEQPHTNPAAGALTGILTDPQYRVVLGGMQHNDHVNLLHEAQVTTLSGRQAQLQLVNVMTVVTNINPQALKPPGIRSTKLDDAMQAMKLSCGPVLDVISTVGADGYTIHLKLKISLIEFLGYEDVGKSNLVTVYLQDKKAQVPKPLPKIRTRELSTEAIVWDGQTLVLSGPTALETPAPDSKEAAAGPNSPVKKNLVAFITPTIIDPAGNRVHDEAPPGIANTVPPQNPR